MNTRTKGKMRALGIIDYIHMKWLLVSTLQCVCMCVCMCLIAHIRLCMCFRRYIYMYVLVNIRYADVIAFVSVGADVLAFLLNSPWSYRLCIYEGIDVFIYTRFIWIYLKICIYMVCEDLCIYLNVYEYTTRQIHMMSWYSCNVWKLNV